MTPAALKAILVDAPVIVDSVRRLIDGLRKLTGGTTPVPGQPDASFTRTPASGVAPLQVAFTDTSTNTPTSWAWSFGDGATSAVRNPTHTYTAPGTYDVTLTVANGVGSDSITSVGSVVVTPAPPVMLMDAA